MKRLARPIPTAPLILAGPALVLGLYAGLQRLGLHLPGSSTSIPAGHGPLMIVGFLAALIGFERAVRGGRRWLLAAPFCAGVSALTSLWSISFSAGLATVAGVLLLVAALDDLRGARWLVAVPHTCAALALCIGSLRWWSGDPLPAVIGAWLGFPLASILGDRLELHSPQARRDDRAWFIIPLAIAVLAGALTANWLTPHKPWVLAAACAALALWLLIFDREGMGFHRPGLPRYHAIGRTLGALWLAVAALALVALPTQPAGMIYDAQLHLLLVGFVLNFIFAHGPVVFAGLFGKTPYWHPWLPVPALMLQFGIVFRIFGDFSQSTELRLVGGVTTALAFVLFLVVTHLKVGRPVPEID